MTCDIEIDGRSRRVQVRRRDRQFVVAVDGREHVVDAVRVDPHTWSLLVGPTSHEVTVAPRAGPGGFVVGVGGGLLTAAVGGRRRPLSDEDGVTGGGLQRVVAPMPGKIVRVLVGDGETVGPRQPLVVIEAMKMENELRASAGGRVVDLRVREGQSVDAGALLLVVSRA